MGQAIDFNLSPLTSAVTGGTSNGRTHRRRGKLARDLQHLLGYAEWRNFATVLSKAKTACDLSGHAVTDHFVDVNKMVDLGSGSQREVDDLMLTRYACYLIAQNGDLQKQPITSSPATRRTNGTWRVCFGWLLAGRASEQECKP